MKKGLRALFVLEWQLERELLQIIFPMSPIVNDHAPTASAEAILRRFADLRIFQRGERRAVHKPLLILLALARLERGEPRLIDYADLDAPLKRLLTEFGPSSAPGSRHYPFWHLRTDGIWELQGPPEILDRPAAATPNLGDLRALHVAGGFAPALDARLRQDVALRKTSACRLLEAHFPPSLHEDIAAELGLDLSSEVPEPSVREDSPSYTVTRARRRDPRFRERVLRAYEYRCCVCGFDLRIGQLSAGLEAAHIQWHTANGPDIESNGLALCALHHKLFDLGGFTIVPDTYSVVFSQHATASESTRQRLLAHHGAGMLLPQSKDYYPAHGFLRWHEQQVFKRPGRDL